MIHVLHQEIIAMDLLNKLEEKIILALETIELLNMENDELKLEVEKLQAEKAQLSQQQLQIESKVTTLLTQFEPQSLAANS